MYGEWGEKHAHADIFIAHCGHQALYCDKFKHIDRSQENVLKDVSVLCVARTPSKGITNGRINTLYCKIARRSPPHLSGSHLSYVSLVDVKKIWQFTTTPNPHVHEV